MMKVRREREKEKERGKKEEEEEGGRGEEEEEEIEERKGEENLWKRSEKNRRFLLLCGERMMLIICFLLCVKEAEISCGFCGFAIYFAMFKRGRTWAGGSEGDQKCIYARLD